MRSFLTPVHPCIAEGGGHLKDIVHKKWNYVKKISTIGNCDVLKLGSITFSKMLFLFIISSLFLPHPVLILLTRQPHGQLQYNRMYKETRQEIGTRRKSKREYKQK
jgi:hypothetical protein